MFLIRWSFATHGLFLHLAPRAEKAVVGGKARAELCYLSRERQESKLKLRKQNDLDTIFLVAAVSREDEGTYSPWERNSDLGSNCYE